MALDKFNAHDRFTIWRKDFQSFTMLTMFKFGCNAKPARIANGAGLRDCNVSYDATFSASPAAAASAVPMLTRELVTRIKKGVQR